MNKMVERVALAISGSDDAKNILGIHRHRARLAIAAMREPTEEMLIEAREWSRVFVGSPIGNKAATGCWQAMHAGALK